MIDASADHNSNVTLIYIPGRLYQIPHIRLSLTESNGDCSALEVAASGNICNSFISLFANVDLDLSTKPEPEDSERVSIDASYIDVVAVKKEMIAIRDRAKENDGLKYYFWSKSADYHRLKNPSTNCVQATIACLKAGGDDWRVLEKLGAMDDQKNMKIISMTLFFYFFYIVVNSVILITLSLSIPRKHITEFEMPLIFEFLIFEMVLSSCFTCLLAMCHIFVDLSDFMSPGRLFYIVKRFQASRGLPCDAEATLRLKSKINIPVEIGIDLLTFRADKIKIPIALFCFLDFPVSLFFIPLIIAQRADVVSMQERLEKIKYDDSAIRILSSGGSNALKLAYEQQLDLTLVFFEEVIYGFDQYARRLLDPLHHPLFDDNTESQNSDMTHHLIPMQHVNDLYQARTIYLYQQDAIIFCLIYHGGSVYSHFNFTEMLKKENSTRLSRIVKDLQWPSSEDKHVFGENKFDSALLECIRRYRGINSFDRYFTYIVRDIFREIYEDLKKLQTRTANVPELGHQSSQSDSPSQPLLSIFHSGYGSVELTRGVVNN